ncbi:hypothetical protein JXQ31_10365 [candidate division KSB1 bacterium]|nr:hypothetical protein [candidate division KSB1 bacterium]
MKIKFKILVIGIIFILQITACNRIPERVEVIADEFIKACTHRDIQKIYSMLCKKDKDVMPAKEFYSMMYDELRLDKKQFFEMDSRFVQILNSIIERDSLGGFLVSKVIVKPDFKLMGDKFTNIDIPDDSSPIPSVLARLNWMAGRDMTIPTCYDTSQLVRVIKEGADYCVDIGFAETRAYDDSMKALEEKINRSIVISNLNFRFNGNFKNCKGYINFKVFNHSNNNVKKLTYEVIPKFHDDTSNNNPYLRLLESLRYLDYVIFEPALKPNESENISRLMKYGSDLFYVYDKLDSAMYEIKMQNVQIEAQDFEKMKKGMVPENIEIYQDLYASVSYMSTFFKNVIPQTLNNR